MSQELVIAFVDDDPNFSEIRIEGLEILLPARYIYYETCDACLAAIAAGQAHDAYLLDQLGGPTLGNVCAELIMEVDPDKPIIGMSIAEVGDQFPPGTEFVEKKSGPEPMGNILRQLLE